MRYINLYYYYYYYSCRYDRYDYDWKPLDIRTACVPILCWLEPVVAEPRGPVAHPLFIVGGGGGAWPPPPPPTFFVFLLVTTEVGHVGGLPLHVWNINVEKIWSPKKKVSESPPPLLISSLRPGPPTFKIVPPPLTGANAYRQQHNSSNAPITAQLSFRFVKINTETVGMSMFLY